MSDKPKPQPPPVLALGQLDALAGALRTEYQRKMAALLQRPAHKLTTKNQDIAVWRKVAAICARCKTDPVSFMQAQFTDCDSRTGPYVNMITGEYAFRKFQEYSIRSRGTNCPNDSELRVTPAEQELQTMIKYASEYLMKVAGTVDPYHPKVLELLRVEYSGLTPYIRCLLCLDDEEVFRRYGVEAKSLLSTDPAMCNAIRVMGLDVDAILTYKSDGR